MKNDQIIIYNTDDGQASVALYAKDGNIWMNQNQIAELFDTSVPNISMHIKNITNEAELSEKSVVKDYLTTASDGKNYLTDCLETEDVLRLIQSIPSPKAEPFKLWLAQVGYQRMERPFRSTRQQIKLF